MSQKSVKFKQRKSVKGKETPKSSNANGVADNSGAPKIQVDGDNLFEPEDGTVSDPSSPRRESMDNLAYTMLLVHRAADKLLKESEQLRDEHRDGIADMTKRVDGIEIRMGSDTGSMSQPSLGSPTASMHTLGSVQNSLISSKDGNAQNMGAISHQTMERHRKYQQNYERFQRDMTHDIHQTVDINGDVHVKRVESVVIIKGGGVKHSRRYLWTQNDRRMFCGLLPTNVYGWKKYYLELFTLLFVMMSVLLIILQSFPEFDPHCVGEVVVVGEWNHSNSTNTTVYSCKTSNHNVDAKAYFTIFYLQMTLVFWFTVEYTLRFMAVRPNWKVHRPYSATDFWKAKLTHVCSFMTMIDLLSISPFYIEQLIKAGGGDPSGAGSILTVLRVIRILRVFKMTKSNQTLTDLFAAFRIIADDMLIILVLLITMMTLLSTAMFFAERGVEHATRFEGEIWFDTILDTFYWTAATITSVGYGDVRPRTRGGRAIAGFTAIMSVLVINLPIAIIIMSFDEVYRIRRGREVRASLVTERLFKWVDRAKMANEKAKHPRKHDVRHRKAEAELKRKTADLAAEQGKQPPVALKLRVVGADAGESPADTLTMKQLTRRNRQIERAKQQRRRDEAMRTMKKLILNPGTATREMENGTYNGQEHYLVSKYFTIWETRTQAGRRERDQVALEAIRTLVNSTEGMLHQKHKDATIRWMKASKGIVEANSVSKKFKKSRKTSFGEMRMRSSNKRGRASSFGAAHGMGHQGRPSIGLAFGKIQVEKSDLGDSDFSTESSDYEN